MDDLDLLRTLAGPDPVPSSEGEARARSALLDRFDNTAPVRRRGRGRLGWRIAIPAVAAAVAVAGMVVAENAGPVGSGHVNSVVPGVGARPANAAEAVGYAADAAARKPFSRPRDDQWFFLEKRATVTGLPGGSNRTDTTRSWFRIDGKKILTDRNGKLVELPTQPLPRDGSSPQWAKWAELAALPANPDAVLAWARAQPPDVGAGDNADQATFDAIGRVLNEYLLPPAVEAAFFRALSGLPGVTLVPGTVNVDGRQAIAVARVRDDRLREELLLDPKTYALVGLRSVVVSEETAKGPDGTVKVRKVVAVLLQVRVAAAIVDEPGQTG